MAKELPSVDTLRSRITYDPQTGKLFWKDCEHMPKQWRTRHSGKEAFTSRDAQGYLIGDLSGVKLKSHRVAYAIYYGFWPNGQIDHINGVKDDNRISNLRVVTNEENHRNKRGQSNNTSGVSGVYWNKICKKWHARIQAGGVNNNLGYFESLEDAKEAREQAKKRLGFSGRHGLTLEEE